MSTSPSFIDGGRRTSIKSSGAPVDVSPRNVSTVPSESRRRHRAFQVNCPFRIRAGFSAQLPEPVNVSDEKEQRPLLGSPRLRNATVPRSSRGRPSSVQLACNSHFPLIVARGSASIGWSQFGQTSRRSEAPARAALAATAAVAKAPGSARRDSSRGATGAARRLTSIAPGSARRASSLGATGAVRRLTSTAATAASKREALYPRLLARREGITSATAMPDRLRRLVAAQCRAVSRKRCLQAA